MRVARPVLRGRDDGNIISLPNQLGGEAWSKVRRLLNDPRTLNHVDWMQAQLVQAVPDPRLREAVARLWYWQASLGRVQGTRSVLAVQMVVIKQLLCQRLAPDWPEAYARVGHISSTWKI